ncbi:MAG: hypothetical protein IH921_09140 [Gemmatimonadetes bacterium]|nr:hypothetical protein [Gemmatimonadota bacterium]
MTTRENLSELAPAQSLVPISRTATVNGTGVDLRDHDSATVVIDAGQSGGTSPSFTFEVQESDDDSTYTAVAPLDRRKRQKWCRPRRPGIPPGTGPPGRGRGRGSGAPGLFFCGRFA